jgi:hypothetical protein
MLLFPLRLYHIRIVINTSNKTINNSNQKLQSSPSPVCGNGLGVGVMLGNSVGAMVGVGVIVSVGVSEGVSEGVGVGVSEGVSLGVGVGVSVGVGVGVGDSLGVGVGVDVLGAIVMVNSCMILPWLFVASNVNVNVPAVVGVPEKIPKYS